MIMMKKALNHCVELLHEYYLHRRVLLHSHLLPSLFSIYLRVGLEIVIVKERSMRKDFVAEEVSTLYLGNLLPSLFLTHFRVGWVGD